MGGMCTKPSDTAEAPPLKNLKIKKELAKPIWIQHTSEFSKENGAVESGVAVENWKKLNENY